MTDEARAIKCDCVYEEFCNLINGGGIFLPKPCSYRKSKEKFAEVVLCKDCKKATKPERTKLEFVWCSKWKNVMEYCDFCSYGERKTNE